MSCEAGLGGGRGIGCEVHISYKGFARTWDYPENVAQFAGLEPGDHIEMLVDPNNPNNAYTVVDVRDLTNSGLGVVFFLGCIFILLGLVGLWWVFTLQRRVGRKVARLSGRSGGVT